MHAVHHAAYAGRVEEVQALLQEDARLLHATGGSNEWPPLIYASYQGHVGLVAWLLDQGARIDHRDRHGRTALYLACCWDRRDVVALLLQRRANPTVAINEGVLPLMAAAGRGQAEVVRLLIREDGVDLDACDCWGQTALHWPALHGHPLVVNILLEAGADPRIRNKNGQTPLDAARTHSHTRCVKLLQEWERSYLLCFCQRAKDLQAALAAHDKSGRHALEMAPECLVRRVRANKPLPDVRVKRSGGLSCWGFLLAWEPIREARVRREVAEHALGTMKHDLFRVIVAQL